MFIYKKLLAKLTGARLVWLRDLQGETKLVLARRNAWGDLTTYWHWPFEVGLVKLMDGGKVENSYVKDWKYAD